MKRFAILLVLALAFAVPGAFAQDHGEVGVFADYVRLHNANDANMLGLGGRLGFNVHPSVQLEAEMAFDFERTFSTTVTGVSGTNTVRSNLSLLHGLFGPKIQTGGGPIRLYGTLKGGFLNFRGGARSTTNVSGFTNQVNNILNGDTNGVFYPAAGLELFGGPIGIRLEVGDLMYFDNGSNNNLRVTVGPQFRF
jgi:Outer membrane protein beta-barrel domain